MADFIPPEAQARVEAAIQAAETHTRAELVAVVAPESDDYRFVVLAFAAVLGLAAPFIWSLGLLQGGAIEAHAASLGVALAILILGRIDGVRRLLAPKSLQHRRAARNARAQFFSQKVRMTRDRAGVLLFVSVFERHVEIIADDAAAAAVPAAVWEEAIAAFVQALRADGPPAGLLAAIAVLDDALAKHLPGDAADQDELPNRLIIL